MDNSKLQNELEYTIQTIRGLRQNEKQNIHMIQHWEEKPESVTRSQLEFFSQREDRSSHQLRSIQNSIQQILKQIQTRSHPEKEFLIEQLTMCVHMTGELAQQEAINSSTGTTVGQDSFLQTSQVFSSLDRMEHNMREELIQLEERLEKVKEQLAHLESN